MEKKRSSLRTRTDNGQYQLSSLLRIDIEHMRLARSIGGERVKCETSNVKFFRAKFDVITETSNYCLFTIHYSPEDVKCETSNVKFFRAKFDVITETSNYCLFTI